MWRVLRICFIECIQGLRLWVPILWGSVRYNSHTACERNGKGMLSTSLFTQNFDVRIFYVMKLKDVNCSLIDKSVEMEKI